MTRTLYDSTDVNAIPRNAQMAAGYLSGRWPTYSQLRSRCPNAILVSIAITASENAQVLDVETGDASPADVPAWCLRQYGRGQIPTVYCNTSTWPAVESACYSAGVGVPQWWEANYSTGPVLGPGVVAHQWDSNDTTNLDTSIVADYWPGVDLAPNEREDSLFHTVDAQGKYHVFAPGTNHDLLHFFQDPSGKWQYDDVSAEVAKNNPGAAAPQVG